MRTSPKDNLRPYANRRSLGRRLLSSWFRRPAIWSACLALVLSTTLLGSLILGSRAESANQITTSLSVTNNHSLAWLSTRDWLRQSNDPTDLFRESVGNRHANTLTPLTPFAPLLFWRTDGTTGLWTGTNWSNPATATGGQPWVPGDDAEFSANSTVTFATNTVSNVTVDDGATVTVTAGGTLTLAGIRTFNIGTGSSLTWPSQSQSTALGNEGAGLIKNGAGVLNWGSGPGTNARYDGGFTLNAGTIIVTGNNALSSGSLSLNGGTLQSSGGLTYTSSSVSIGGDFTFAGSGNDVFGQTVSLGASTRTITNGTTTAGATRTFSNAISGGSGAGLTFTGAGASNSSIVLSGTNNYTGDTTINGGKVSLGSAGSIANSPNIIIGGGGTFDVSTHSGLTLAAGQSLQGSGTATAGTIATAASNGLSTAPDSPLKFTAFNGTAPLTISGAGIVTLASGNPVTVNTTSALGAGDYTLISKGATGTVSGTVPTALTIGGSGLAAGMGGVLQITGSQLVLHVAAAGSLQLSASTYTDSETNADHSFNAVVTRTGGSTGAVTVAYQVTDGTATVGGNDYTVSPASGTLSWADGDASAKNITITVKGDTAVESDETVNFSISSPTGGATLGTSSSVLTITNDDVGNAISGRVFDANGSPLNAHIIKLIRNGTVSGTTATTDVNGAYSFTGVPLLSGDRIAVFISGATEKGATVTLSGTTDITNLDIRQSLLRVRTDNGGSISNANLKDAQGASPDPDVTAEGTLDGSNVLTVPAGFSVEITTDTTYAPGADLNLGGHFINNGTFVAATHTVTFNGTANQTIGGTRSTTFYGLTIANTGTSPANMVTLDGSLGATNTIVSLLNINTGVFDQGTTTASSDLTVDGAANTFGTCIFIQPGGHWVNTTQRDVTLFCNVSNQGTIEFNANGSGCGQNDDILVRSNILGTQRTWAGPGTFSMTDVNVRDQKVPGGATLPLEILVHSGTDANNNTGWIFVNDCDAYTWVGAFGQDWANPYNWSPIRYTANNPFTSDVLIFDGNITPSPLVNSTTQTNASIQLKNGVALTLDPVGGGTLTLNGGSGSDLDVPAGTSLTFEGFNPLVISLTGLGHQCDVGGQIIMEGSSHKLLGANPGEITMSGVNAFTTTTGFTGNPFGQNTDGSVVFLDGSTGFFNAGDDPFGGPHSVVTFNSGSTASFGASSPFSSSGRTYGNLILGGNVNYPPLLTGETTVLNNFTLEADSTWTLSGDLNLHGNFEDKSLGVGTFDASSVTVKFTGGSATQTVFKHGANPLVLDNVFIAETLGGKTQLLSALVINGQLNLSTANSLLELNQNALTLNGNVTGPGNLKGDSLAALNIGGAGSLGSPGDPLKFVTGSQTLSQMTMNRLSSGSVTLGNDLSVNDTLNLFHGVVDMGTFTLTANGAVSRTTGWIIGNEQRFHTCLTTTCPLTFDVGTANGYSPVSEVLHLGAGSGTYNQTIKAIEGKHPSIHGVGVPALHRYWTLSSVAGPSFLNADLTFNYLGGIPPGGDVVGTEANYKIFKFDGSFTQFEPSAPIDTVNHDATLNGVSSFSDWTLAETSAVVPGTISFVSAPYTTLEGNADHDVTITVSRAGGADGAVAVNYAVADGTANTPADYQVTQVNGVASNAASGTFTWADGDLSNRTITITIKGDTDVEPDEIVNLTLSGATGGATIGAPNPTTLIITDDDHALSINPTSTVTEGDSGQQNMTFTVTLTPASGQTVTVHYATANGSTNPATGGGTCGGTTDYVTTSGTLTFNPTVTTQTIDVPVCGDTSDEPDETLTVTLDTPTNATISQATGTGTITDNDPSPTISISDVTQSEGDAGATNFIFTVSLSNPSAGTITVNYATAPGTTNPATAGATCGGSTDYQTRSGTVTFNPGETSNNTEIVVSVCGDTLVEPDETFFVNLSASSPNSILPPNTKGTGTITNDDHELAINATSTVTEGNSGQQNMTFTVTLAPSSNQTVTVHYSTANGLNDPATGGVACGGSVDYVTTSGTLTFNPTETTKTIDVPVCGDTLVEPDETLAVTLDTPTNATISQTTGTGTIGNDDHAPVANAVSAATAVSTLKTITLSATDGDGDAQTFSIVDSPQHGTLANFGAPSCSLGACTETVDYTPTAAYTGADTFTYKTNDGPNDSNTATVSIEVFPCPATFTVNSLGDESDAAAGNGHCDVDANTPGDQCTLRAAIEEANALATCGPINIDATGVTGQIDLGTALPAIDHDVNINGPGVGTLAVQRSTAPATPDFRIFQINTGKTVAIDALTIANGKLSANSEAGGGLLNLGTLTLTNSTVSGNQINNSTSFQWGGGIYNTLDGTLTIINSTVSGNSVTGPDARGGGIFSNSGTVTIINSTLSGNTATGVGPGTTLSSGGGLRVQTGTATITNSTVSGNSATGGSGTTKQGGGIFNNSILNIRNTIIALNTSDTGVDISGAATSLGHNLIGNTTGATVAPQPGDKFDANASPLNLGALANNGGPTQTMALGSGSVAIDTGDDCVVDAGHCSDANLPQLTTDQRGTGFPRQSGVHVDIGAYEKVIASPGTLQFSAADYPSQEEDSSTHTVTVTVTRIGGSDGTASVHYETSDGTATLTGNDYDAISGDFTWTDGDVTSRTFNVTIHGDNTYEANETVTLTLSNAINATIGATNPATVTIQNDDAAPTISIGNVTQDELHTGTSNFIFTVTLSNPSQDPVTVNYATAPGTSNPATARATCGGDADYQDVSGILTFNPGETSNNTTIQVPVCGDPVFEADETFFVVLSTNSPNSTLLANTHGTGTITNDDPQPDTDLSLSGGDLVITDSNGGNSDDAITISLNDPNVRITDPNHLLGCGGGVSIDTHTCEFPFASISSIHVNTMGGNDSLTLALADGDIIPDGGLFYDGGAQTTADKLFITGGDQGKVTYNYTSANDGSIDMEHFGLVTYTGLEPIGNTGTASDIVINLPSVDNVATLSDHGGGQSRLASSPVTFEQTDFPNPSGSVTINGGTLKDSLTVSGLAANYPSLIINGGQGDDTVSITGNITFAANANLDLNLQDDVAPVGTDRVTVSTGQVITSGTGTINIQASQDVTVDSGALLQVENGTLTIEANQQATSTAGNHHGVDVNGATIQSTGTGDISIKGTGGAGSSFNEMYGVYVRTGGKILSAGSGLITVKGTGGARTGGAIAGSQMYGVYVFLPGSEISSTSAAITIDGFGGATNDTGSYGVVVGGGKVQQSGAGTLIINGTGGTCTGGNVNTANSIGVGVFSDQTATPAGGIVTSTGTAPNAGNISITGVAGDGGSGGSQGIRVDDPGTVTTVDGSLTFEGTGAAGTNSSLGISIRGAVTATGAGAISMTGTGASAPGSTPAHGVNVRNGGGVTTFDGNITITGTGGTSTNNAGFDLAPGSPGTLQTTGAGNIIINADRIRITPDASAAIDVSRNAVSIRPKTAGTFIDLGSTTDTTANLELSDGELDRIACFTLNIGDNNSESITVTADITRPASTNMVFTSGCDIVISGGQIDTFGGTLKLDSGPSPDAVKPIHAGTDVTASTLSFGSDLAIVINATAVPGPPAFDTDYTQLNVSGDIDLTGVDLALSGTYTPANGDVFTIIVNNANSNPITGNLTLVAGPFGTDSNGGSLAEGDTITNFFGSSASATITYTGGDGNDVQLTVFGATAPEIDVQGNATSIASGDNTPDAGDGTDFIHVTTGNSASHTFTILNTGAAPLNLTDTSPNFVKVIGSSDFTVTTQPTSPVAANDSTTFVVKYTPSAIGPATATISIANDDPDEHPYVFDVKGKGIDPCPAVLTVNVSSDEPDANPGDGVCETALGNEQCTLRAAIMESNQLGSCAPVTINFALTPGSEPQTITLESALDTITRSVTIQGPTGQMVLIDGGFENRILQVASGVTTNISNLIFMDASDANDGAALRNNGGTVNISNSVFTGNQTSDSNGAAIANSSGTMNIWNSTFSSNQASDSGNGGAIYVNTGTVTLTNDTISDNVAAENGGGVFNQSGTVNVRNTIIARNSCNLFPCNSDVQGIFVSLGHNIIGAGDGAPAFVNGTNGDHVGTEDFPFDAGLGQFDDHGGTTMTYSLLPASAAVEGGDNCVLLGCAGTNITADQRGVVRPQAVLVDIGAYEMDTFVVNTTADHAPGPCQPLGLPGEDCTLREAIRDANLASNPSQIAFAIPDGVSGPVCISGLCPIALDSAQGPLPPITYPVLINGYTQPGTKVNDKNLSAGDNAVLKIVLSGFASPGLIGLDFCPGSTTSAVKGLVINNFQGAGIRLKNDGANLVAGNFIGTDAAGLNQVANGNGVAVVFGIFNLIGGEEPADRNLISGNTGDGVQIAGYNTGGHYVEGNYIGTKIDGDTALPNNIGVNLFKFTSLNTIGCEVENGDNVISGNAVAGISINQSDENFIEGNLIGTDKTGGHARPNAVGVDILDASDNFVGSFGFGSVISGNTVAGVRIKTTPDSTCPSNGNLVAGNKIGTNAAGTGAIANDIGILIQDSSINDIGSGDPEDRNVISGNTNEGVRLENANGIFVFGNYIGTDVTGAAQVANGTGVEVTGGSDNEIGCTIPGSTNVISGNTGNGVELTGTTSGNYVQSNLIGVQADQNSPLANGGIGVEVNGASGNIIGFEPGFVIVDDERPSRDGAQAKTRTAAAPQAGVAAGRGGCSKRASANNQNTQTFKAAQQLKATAAKFMQNSPQLQSRAALNGGAMKDLAAAASAKATSKAGRSPGAKLTSGAKAQGLARRDVTFNSVSGNGDNIIANNVSDGVRVTNNTDLNNRISQNSIYTNGGLGINLGIDGVTTNNIAGHTGPNNYQNFPELLYANPSDQNIGFKMDGTGGSGPFTIEFFVNDTCDGTNGEGKQWIGSLGGVSSGGPQTFPAPPASFTNGKVITATATDSAGNTSEFSECMVAGPPAISIDSYTHGEGNSGTTDFTFNVTLSHSYNEAVTVQYATQNGTTNPATGGTCGSAGVDYATSSGPLTFNPGDKTIPVTISVCGDTFIEPNETFFVNLSTPVNATIANAQGLGTINDDDACPTTFTVNSLADSDDVSPGDGHCDIDSSTIGDQCTLRAAIREANALTSCGAIDIDLLGVSGTIDLSAVLPTIDHNVNLKGPGANVLTVQRNSAASFRIFNINPNRVVNLSGLTIKNGAEATGGGIYNNHGKLTIDSCEITGNAATSEGGGIYNGGIGPGPATLIITNSTISNNGSDVDGGGVDSDSDLGSASLTMTNCTVSGNTAKQNGGGVYVVSSPATLTNVTITNNRADNDTTGGGLGGGLGNSGGTVTLRNTIAAGNFRGGDPSSTRDDINGALLGASSYNLVGDESGMTGISNGPNNNQVGSASTPLIPYLGLLIYNGGATRTHGLLYNSPAIDAGDDTVTGAPLNLTKDQRGLTRSADGDLTAGSHVDIGAYERQTIEERFAPTGPNVSVDINDVKLTFPSVSNVQPQTVQLTVNPVPGDAPSGSGPVFDVTPTSNFYTPPVTLCFYLPAITNPTTFGTVKIYHREGGVLVEHSEQRDFASKTVCINDITSFSQFVVVQPVTPTAANGKVSGQIMDSNGHPVEGAAVRLSGTQNRLTITDAEGNYHFDEVDTNGFYIVTPSRANFAFSPNQRSFSQLGAHTDAVFTGTPAGTVVNPLDATEYFVRQQYVDFLGREPDESGFNFWVNNIESCGNNSACREVKRIDTSAAFFLSIEFQQTGFLVYRAYEAAYGDLDSAPVPLTLGEFVPDTEKVSNGVVVLQTDWQRKLEANKQAFMSEFVQRPRFTALYPTSMTPAQFVDKLFAAAHVDSTDPDYAASLALFGAASDTSNVAARAQALRRLAENSSLTRRQFNRAFVLMEYFGYLRRNPNSGRDTDFSGYSFWLDKLDAFNGSFQNAEMVKAFLSSTEYRGRFPR